MSAKPTLKWGCIFLLVHLLVAPVLVIPGVLLPDVGLGRVARGLSDIAYAPVTYLLQDHYWQERLLVPLATWLWAQGAFDHLEAIATTQLVVTWLIGAPLYFLIGYSLKATCAALARRSD